MVLLVGFEGLDVGFECGVGGMVGLFGVDGM